MQQLTKSEEQIIQVLWKLEQAFVKEIRERLPGPRPAYNTVSTIVRILEKKGFVGHKAYGRAHQYYPLVSKKQYSAFLSKRLLQNYFSGSFRQLVSFFAENQEPSIEEVEEAIRILEGKKKYKNNKPR